MRFQAYFVCKRRTKMSKLTFNHFILGSFFCVACTGLSAYHHGVALPVKVPICENVKTVKRQDLNPTCHKVCSDAGLGDGRQPGSGSANHCLCTKVYEY